MSKLFERQIQCCFSKYRWWLFIAHRLCMIGEYFLLTSNWLLSPQQCWTSSRDRLVQGQIFQPKTKREFGWFYIHVYEKKVVEIFKPCQKSFDTTRYYVSVNWRTCVCQHLLVVAIDLSRYGTFSHMIIYLCFLKSHSFYYFSVNFYHWDFLKNAQLTKSLALPITFKSFFNSWYFLSSNRIPNEMLAFFRSLSLLQKNENQLVCRTVFVFFHKNYINIQTVLSIHIWRYIMIL